MRDGNRKVELPGSVCKIADECVASRTVERYLTILVALAVDRNVSATTSEMHMLTLEAGQLLGPQTGVERDD